jgi:ABC-type sulfate transport system substrate-binding protein
MIGSNNISKTNYAEDSRISQQENQRNQLDRHKILHGIITDIHKEKNLIKANSETGTSLANGDWIPLNHTIDEVIERFGKLRKGMTVRVDSDGVSSGQAIATIVGLESDTVSQDTSLINEVEKSLFAIFVP